jgi:hypothetical protein
VTASTAPILGPRPGPPSWALRTRLGGGEQCIRGTLNKAHGWCIRGTPLLNPYPWHGTPPARHAPLSRAARPSPACTFPTPPPVSRRVAPRSLPRRAHGLLRAAAAGHRRSIGRSPDEDVGRVSWSLPSAAIIMRWKRPMVRCRLMARCSVVGLSESMGSARLEEKSAARLEEKTRGSELL